MRELDRITLMNLATDHIDLRFPKISLQVLSPYNMDKEGRVNMSTFVASKNKERLILLTRSYSTSSSEDVFLVVEKLRDRFISEANKISEHGIFDEVFSIAEPYLYNVNKTL
jgi:hypothetical protein